MKTSAVDKRFMTFFLSTFCTVTIVFAPAARALTCSKLFARQIPNAITLKDISVTADRKGEVYYVDGVRTRVLTNEGKENWFILFNGEMGVPTVYKIIGANGDTRTLLEGVKLGAAFGGPALYSHGRATTGANIRNRGVGYYFQLEALFPNENSYNVKDYGLSEAKASSKKILSEIAKSFVSFAREGIIPVDPDVLYTPDLRWRWIDADFWLRGDPLKVPFQVGQFARNLDNESARTLARFIIETGSDLPAALLAEFQKELAYYLKTN